MDSNIKFYTITAVVVFAVVLLSVSILGGFGLLLDCVLVAALSGLSD